MKNHWRQQSTRGKAEDEVDNDRQDDCTDDAGQGAPKVDWDHCKGARSERDDADCLGNRLGLDFEGKFHAPKQWRPIKKQRRT